MQIKPSIVIRNNKPFFIRFFAGLMAVIAIIVCGINIAKAIEHSPITVASTSGDIEVIGNRIENLTITPTLVFNKTGDSITYQTTLESTSNTSFQINSISDDNTNSFITTSYEYDTALNADPKSILITLSYTSYVPSESDFNLNDIHITLSVDENEPDEPDDSGDPDDSGGSGDSEDPEDSDSSEDSDGSEDSEDSDDSDDHHSSNNSSADSSDTDHPQDNTPSSSNIEIPNTGAPNHKSVTLSSANNENILPFLIIGIIAIATIITVIPTPRNHRITFHIIELVALSSIIGGVVSTKTFANTSQLRITIVGANVSAMPNTPSPQNVVSAIFPNIYNTPTIQVQRDEWAAEHDNKSLSPGNAIILKTQDNKYVLMDTGPKLTTIQDAIYEKLKELQGTDTVTIDYFIISHLDSDHRGNAVTFMHHPEKFNIKNIVFKHEITADDAQQTAFESIADEAASQDIHIITSGDTETSNYLNGLGVTDYTRLNEGMTLQVGQYLTLHIFNTANVYAGKDCLSGKRISWTADIESPYLLKTSDDKYIYFDGTQYQFEYNPLNLDSAKYPNSNVTFKTTSSLITKTNGSGMNQYFYARRAAEGNICSSNPNSFGILAEIAAGDQKKYMYFTGDIENAGYSTLSSGANSAQLYNSYTFSDNDFRDVDPNSYTIPAEDDTAIAIYNKLASDAASQGLSVDTLLNNIVLYQMSHHGGNNSERAVWKLKLNRSSGIYAIQDGDTDMTDSKDFRLNKTYYFTLGNLPDANKIHVFAKGNDTEKPIDGVDCTVNSLGTTTCARY